MIPAEYPVFMVGLFLYVHNEEGGGEGGGDQHILKRIITPHVSMFVN
jgi:hypothetical protein